MKKENWLTTPRERTSYLTYFTGQNIYYTLVTSFMATYMLFLGINPMKSAAVMLVVKIWDALNDAFFGCLMDKARFKNGRKFLPWLRISVGLLPIATILLFSIPQDSSETVKLVWFAAAYLLWDTVYTLCDAPAFGMSTTMTNRLDERESLISYSRITGGVGMGIAYLLCTVLISEHVGLNLGIGSIMLSVIAVAFMLPLCIFGRERTLEDVSEPKKGPTVKQIFAYLGKNKFLLILFIGSFFSGALQTVNSLFASFYLFHNSLYSLIVIAASVVPVLIFALIVPKIIKRVDKYFILMISNILVFVFGLIIWAIGYEHIVAYFVLTVVKSVPAAISGIILLMFTPDCVEYGKFKTGTDASGIAFSVQTFMAKITAAIAGSLGLFILGLFGWVPVSATNFEELAAAGVVQSARALDGLWFTNTLLPAIGAGIAVIVWIFYRLRDRDVLAMTDFNAGRITREEALEKIKCKL